MKYSMVFNVFLIGICLLLNACSTEEEPILYDFTVDKEIFVERKAFLDETYEGIRKDRLSKKYEKKDQKTLKKILDEERIIYHRRHMINTLAPLRYDNTLVVHCDSRNDEKDILLKSLIFKYQEARIDEYATSTFVEQLNLVDTNNYDASKITSNEHSIAREIRAFNNKRYVLLVDDIINTNPLVIDYRNFASGLIFAKVHVIDLQLKKNIDYFHVYAKNLEEIKVVGNQRRGQINEYELGNWLQTDLEETFYATLLFTSYYVVHDADLSKKAIEN